MTAPMPPVSERERRARLQRELATLQAAVNEGRLPPAAIQRYVEREQITPEMEQARTPLSAAENVAGGITSAVQGATFNFGDELIGALDPGRTIAEVRRDQSRFEGAHPNVGLGLELAGGLASGLALAPAALGTRAAGGAAGVGATAARAAGSAAGGGALAGYGSGEGGPVSPDRLVRGVAGGAVGGVLGAAANKVASSPAVQRGGRKLTDFLNDIAGDAGGGQMARATAGAVPAPVTSTMPMGPFPEAWTRPAAQRAVARAIGGEGGEMTAARASLDALDAAGMGDEALLMNVGGDPAARLTRAVSNAPSVPFARQNAKQVVDEALARQGGALGESVADDIGRVTGVGNEPGPIALDRMQRELSGKVGAGYEAFRALPEVPLDPNDEAQRLFIERYVDPVIRNRGLTGNLSGRSALSGANVDAAFKNLQRDVRGANAAVSMGARGVNEAQGLEAMRDRVLAAIGQTDPAYADLARTYALDADVGKVVQEAFDVGQGLPTKPVGTATVELGKTTPAGQDAMRRGAATALRGRANQRAANAELGDLAQFRDVARSVIGNVDDRERFIELFGRDAYDNLAARLSPKIRAAAMNAAARGNSTTARQMLDAMALGDNAVLDLLESGAKGGLPSMAMNVGQRFVGDPLRAAFTTGLGQSAEDAARMLTTRGSGNIRTLLELLEAEGQRDVARRAAVRPVAGLATRGAVEGMP